MKRQELIEIIDGIKDPFKKRDTLAKIITTQQETIQMLVDRIQLPYIKRSVLINMILYQKGILKTLDRIYAYLDASEDGSEGE